MNYEKEREIKIKIIEAIQEAEEEFGFELDASKEAGTAEMIFNKIREEIKNERKI
jgi:hypothetical protein